MLTKSTFLFCYCNDVVTRSGASWFTGDGIQIILDPGETPLFNPMSGERFVVRYMISRDHLDRVLNFIGDGIEEDEFHLQMALITE